MCTISYLTPPPCTERLTTKLQCSSYLKIVSLLCKFASDHDLIHHHHPPPSLMRSSTRQQKWARHLLQPSMTSLKWWQSCITPTYLASTTRCQADRVSLIKLWHFQLQFLAFINHCSGDVSICYDMTHPYLLHSCASTFYIYGLLLSLW